MQTLTEKRIKALADARSILDGAKSAGRGMNAEEVRRYDKFVADADACKATIDREATADRLDDEARARVPAAVIDGAYGAVSDETGSLVVLGKAQRCVDAVRSGGCAYASDIARGERLSLGKIVLA